MAKIIRGGLKTSISLNLGGGSRATITPTEAGTDVKNNLEIKDKELAIAIKKGALKKQETETGKIPAAQLGYYTMAKSSIKDYGDLKNELASGNLKYDDIRMAFGKTPTDQTAIINNILYNGTDAWLRIQTGAQANPSEIAREMSKFQPKPWDSDKVIDYKLKSLFENRLGLYNQMLEENTGKAKGKNPEKISVSAVDHPIIAELKKKGATLEEIRVVKQKLGVK